MERSRETTRTPLRRGILLEFKVEKWYVYFGYVKGVIVYIGKGSGMRYAHLNSGKSCCYEANAHHHSGGEVVVEIVKRFSVESEALTYEREQISSLMPLWNIIHMSNVRNKRKRVTRKTKSKVNSYMGVTRRVRHNKHADISYWTAKLNIDGRCIHIGNFNSEIEAAMARDKYIVKNNLQSLFVLNF